MKKKLVALILLIPLLLVFTTFSLATVAVLAVPIPVTGIEISMNEVEYLDLSEGGTLKVEARVLPDTAKEKGVTYRADAVEGKSRAEVSFDADGTLVARSTGSAKIVVTTKDGGYKAGFLLEVSSKTAVGLVFAASEIVLAEGETRQNSAAVAPFTALDKNAEYFAEDPETVKVDPLTGAATGLLPGKTRVIARLRNGLRDDGTAWQPSELTAAYRVEVTENAADDVLVNGRAGAELAEYLSGGNAALTVSVKNSAYLGAQNARDNPSDEEKLEAFTRFAKLSKGTYAPELVYASGEKTAFRLSVEAEEGASLTLGATEVEFRGSDRLDAAALVAAKTTLLVGERLRLGAATLPETPEGLRVSYSVSNEAVAAVEERDNAYYLVGKTAGTVDVTLTANVGAVSIEDTLSATVAASPKSVNFRLNSKIWGIKERYAFASKKYANGVEAKDSLPLELVADGAVDYADYDLASSDPAVAEIINGRLYVRGNGTVTVTARPKNADAFGIPAEYFASVTLDCADGLNVSDYESLRFASTKGRKIALQADVAVGKDVSGLPTEEKKRVLREELFSIPTTADWSYYRLAPEIKATSAPTVKVAVEFKDDLYGNGYALNAHNITSVRDGSNLPLYDAGFGGPLHMVAASMSGLSASVKAQDNIVFLVRNDGVKLDNVELLSRDLAPNEQGLVELNDLNYAGTTLEITGDGASLLNSRVRNGRTCVRIFGGADPDRRIGVTVESCILSYAREFILKTGTNKTLPSKERALTPDELQPKLSAAGRVYEPRRDANFSDAAFVENFVKTEVTVKNSAFYTSGIFAVGVESKFGGEAFRPNGNPSFDSWFEASGTSYAARLRFEGDVGLYDWKDVEKIDSSTLIETSGAIEQLKFNVAEILKKVAAQQPDRFGNLLSEYGGASYAHGGVAFYGGGKNYSALDVSGLDAASDAKRLKEYSVPLTVLDNATYLIAAAGTEPFRFFMFDRENGMSVEKQNELLFNGKAFDLPPARG